ncbi:LysR family transcriptional regulator ArgP [Cnuibacter sp. UC19_7]|uniref:LysR family transcriptional regulator ArgP n=1 Tax=Cnuibacter sp. UC19_7 TaxID=3350166 RepID=UPI00366FC1A9
MMNLQPDQLAALRAVVEEGTFDRAARALSVTQSAVSQRIKALETAVGAVLVTRTRPAAPTATGEVLLQLGREIDLLSREALVRIGAAESIRPEVPIAVNADSLATWFLPAVAPLIETVGLRVLREDEGHTPALLRDGSAMAAVTSDREPVQGCSVEPLGAMRYRPRASRAFADRWFADGASPASFAVAPVVAFDAKDDMQDALLRTHGLEASAVPHTFIPASVDMADAVRRGFGWAMLPDLQVGDGDDLVTIVEAGTRDVPLYWQQWRLRSVALTAVADAVRAGAAAALRR